MDLLIISIHHNNKKNTNNNNNNNNNNNFTFPDNLKSIIFGVILGHIRNTRGKSIIEGLKITS